MRPIALYCVQVYYTVRGGHLLGGEVLIAVYHDYLQPQLRSSLPLICTHEARLEFDVEVALVIELGESLGKSFGQSVGHGDG